MADPSERGKAWPAAKDALTDQASFSNYSPGKHLFMRSGYPTDPGSRREGNSI